MNFLVVANETNSAHRVIDSLLTVSVVTPFYFRSVVTLEHVAIHGDSP